MKVLELIVDGEMARQQKKEAKLLKEQRPQWLNNGDNGAD